MRIQLPAVGQSYTHTDLPLSAQVTRNWIPEINQETSKTVTLQPYPGASLFATIAEGEDRGMTVWDRTLYAVVGGTLYSVDEDGLEASVGTILGNYRCTFASSLEWLVIVTFPHAYMYDGTTLTKISDTDLTSEFPSTVTFLNNQWIYQGLGHRFAVSDAGLPGTINGLNYAAAESAGDLLICVYAFQQYVYMMGEATIEPWWNSGSGFPPFDRVEGGIIQKGCAARHSVSHNDQYLYFLGDDRIVYQLSGSSVNPVSTIPLARLFESYDEVFEAIGFCYTLYGQNYYHITLQDRTWVYSESAGAWFELSVGYDDAQYPATAYAYCYQKHLVAAAGSIYELDDSALFDDQPMVRERVTGTINAELLGQEYIGRELFQSRAEIIIKGIPPVNTEPKIMLSFSDDAGYTWSNERIITCGALGNYTFKAVAHQLGRFYDRVFKIRIADENRYSLHRMSGDFDVGY